MRVNWTQLWTQVFHYGHDRVRTTEHSSFLRILLSVARCAVCAFSGPTLDPVSLSTRPGGAGGPYPPVTHVRDCCRAWDELH
jgi:hypothetical protein